MDIRSTNIPLWLVLENSNFRGLETLSYYIRLKSAYKNPIIYNFSYQKAANIMGCGKSTAHKFISRMIDLKLGEFHKGHFRLFGVNKLNKGRKRKLVVKIPVYQNKRDNKTSLQSVIIRNTCSKQAYSHNKKNEIVQNCKKQFHRFTKPELKFIAKSGGLEKLESSAKSGNRVTLSNRKIGSIFGMSSQTGKNYQRKLNRLNCIKSVAHFIPVRHSVDKEILRYFNGSPHYFVSNNTLYRRTSNTIYNYSLSLFTDKTQLRVESPAK